MSEDNTNIWNRRSEVTYTDLSKAYAFAMEWLFSNGIVRKNSRLEIYQKVFDDISNKSHSIDDIKSRYDEDSIMGALYDGTELIEIYNSLCNLSGCIPELYFKNILSGPLAYYNETEKNSCSRNLIFELYIASKLKASGFDIKLDCISDIEIEHENHQIFVECKRLTSLNQFAKRLKEGYRQLNKSCAANFGHNCYGMLFISLSKIISPGLIDVTDSSFDKIRNSIRKYFISILDHNFEELKKASNKTLCVWLHTRMPFLTENMEVGVYSRHLSFDLIEEDSIGWEILSSINKKLNLSSSSLYDWLNVLCS